MTTTNPTGDPRTIWINDTNGHAYRDNVDLEAIGNVDYLSNFETYNISGLNIPANTSVTLTNFSTINNGLNGFDPVTGEWTCPSDGFYAYGLFYGITTGANRTEVSLELFDVPTLIPRYLCTLLTADLSAPVSGYEGAVTFNSINYFQAGEVLSQSIRINTTETVDIIVRIIKIL